MFNALFKFELKYWFTNISFYVYAGIFFLFAFASMAGAAGAFGEGSVSGAQLANSPLSLFNFALFFNKLLLLILPAIIGTTIYRDYRYNVHDILYTYPFTKAAYLLSKFASAFFIVTILAVLIQLGLWLATILPFADPELLLPFDAKPYLQSSLLFIIPNLFLFSSIVFAVVLETRNIYTAFILMIVLWLLKEIFNRLAGSTYAGILLEPFGESAIQYYTKNWTIANRNIFDLPLTPLVFINRIIWTGLGLCIFLITFRRFSFSHTIASVRWKGVSTIREKNSVITGVFKPITARSNFSWLSQLKAVWQLSLTNLRFILSNGAFITLVVSGSLFILVLLTQINPYTDTRILPLTWTILAYPVFFFSFLIQILTFLYAGVLVQRAKSARFVDIISASPVSNWVLLLSKLSALIGMQVILLALIMLMGIAVQTFSGISDFEITHYLFHLFGIHLIGYVIWAMAALFIQTLLDNTFLGVFVLVLAALGISNLSDFGIEHYVFMFNRTPNDDFYLKYSDFHDFLKAPVVYFWYKLYWLTGAVALMGITLLFWQRELYHSWKERLFIARKRCKGILAATIVFFTLSFIFIGAYLYHCENKPENRPFSLNKENALIQQFQQKYKAYRYTRQPRITAVFAKMEIYPESQFFKAQGSYILVNKTDKPIDTLLIKSGFDVPTTIENRDWKKIAEDSLTNFSVYKLDRPLLPNDSILFLFSIKSRPNTVYNRYSDVLENGTYLKSDIFPRFGYFAETEIAHPENPGALYNHYQSIDADLVRFETIVSTSQDQIAIAPGILEAEWIEKGRAYFHYRMENPFKFVFGYHSGRYSTYYERYRGVECKIYHHPTHTYNLPQLVDGLKSSLDYHTEHFGPYPYKQAHIIEFARSEGSYATTAGNCIPTSEIRFVNDNRVVQRGGADLAFYVIAHELSHQWWGAQVIPANVLGASFVTESLAEYNTAKIYEKKYDRERVLKFLEIQKNRYLSGLTTATENEAPLMYVTPEQTHISYGRGALALYTLSEYIGEEKMNAALKNYFDKAKYKAPPYTTSLELLHYLKMETPDSLQHVVTDLFEKPGSEILLRYVQDACR